MKKTKTAFLLASILCLGFLLQFCPKSNLRQLKAETIENQTDIQTVFINGSQFNDPLGRLSFNGIEFDEEIEIYDFFHVSTIEEHICVGDWLTYLGFDLEDETDCNWISDNVNKIIVKAIESGIVRNFLSETMRGLYKSMHLH